MNFSSLIFVVFFKVARQDFLEGMYLLHFKFEYLAHWR